MYETRENANNRSLSLTFSQRDSEFVGIRNFKKTQLSDKHGQVGLMLFESQNAQTN